MKKAIYILITLVLILLIGYKFLNQKEFIRSERSPDGKYIVEIYKEKRFFSVPGDGGISGSLGYIRLLDNKGNKIGDTSNCPSFSLADIELDFNIVNNNFFYAKGESINIEKGKCG